jgi:hypothetical protein
MPCHHKLDGYLTAYLDGAGLRDDPKGPLFRTIRKSCLSNKTALAMVFKLVDEAQKNWRRLDGHNQLPKLIQGVRFTDGIEVAANPAASQSQTAAA